MEPYFIDVNRAQSIKKNYEVTLIECNRVIDLYTEVTGFKFKNLEDVKEFFADPDTKYGDQFIQANQKKFGPLLELPGLEISQLIQKPERWPDVLYAVQLCTEHHKLNQFFMVKEGRIAFSSDLDKYIDRETVFTVKNDIEAKRLKVAQKFIDAYSSLESVVVKSLAGRQSFINEKAFASHSEIVTVQGSGASKWNGQQIKRAEYKIFPRPDFIIYGYRNQSPRGVLSNVRPYTPTVE